jgi:hypothetical protein
MVCIVVTMRVIIEIASKSELDKITALFKTVKVVSSDMPQTSITKGDKQLDPKGLFGIWAKQPRNIDAIRKATWQRS